MSIKVKLEKDAKAEDEIVEKEELEDVEDTGNADEQDNDRESRDLEIENAHLKGKLEALQIQPKKEAQMSQSERARIQLLNDTNNLTDEQFEGIYKAPKHQVMVTFLDQQLQNTKFENQQKLNESEAMQELAGKYGKDFSKYKKDLREALEDLSPAVRQDPERLSRALERQFLALSKLDESVVKKAPIKKKEDDMQRRKIITDFEKPGVAGGDDIKPPSDTSKSDELKPEHKELGSRWFEKESERKQYLGKVVHVPMNFGNGVVFKDPKKGFEKVATGTDQK